MSHFTSERIGPELLFTACEHQSPGCAECECDALRARVEELEADANECKARLAFAERLLRDVLDEVDWSDVASERVEPTIRAFLALAREVKP